MDNSIQSTSSKDDTNESTIEPPNKKMCITNNFTQILKKNKSIHNKDNICQEKLEPFRHFIIDDVIKDTDVLERFVENLKDIPLNDKSSDLFKFSQSQNLFALEDQNEYLLNILNFLKFECGQMLTTLTGNDIGSKIIATLSVYKKNDYLLCHDDLSGDRSFAFILYLNKEWNSNDGGQLQLFSHDDQGYPSQSISNYYPKFNRMIVFQVTSTSYHQVKEIIGNSERISINGWFHGGVNPNKKVKFQKLPIITSSRHYNLKQNEVLKEFLNILYLDLEHLQRIRQMIIKRSAVYLHDLFQLEKFNKIHEILYSNENLNWQVYGPSNHRNCYKLQMDDCPNELFEFISLFHSPQFIIYLEDLCKMTINVNSEQRDEQLQVHVYKWIPGTYTLIHDLDSEFQKMSLDIIIFFVNEEFDEINGGTVHYVAQDEEEELATIVPLNNSLSLVIRDPQTLRFTKYLNAFQKSFYSITVTYSDIEVPDATSSEESE